VSEQGAAPYGDPLTIPFWEAARRHELLLQRCADCGGWQFYPRPFCLRCGSAAVGWARASGAGTVHSQTTVHLKVIPELDPPYVVALIRLDEGPLFTANVVGAPTAIGDRVTVAWRERGALPPLPVFRRLDEAPGVGADGGA